MGKDTENDKNNVTDSGNIHPSLSQICHNKYRHMDWLLLHRSYFQNFCNWVVPNIKSYLWYKEMLWIFTRVAAVFRRKVWTHMILWMVFFSLYYLLYIIICYLTVLNLHSIYTIYMTIDKSPAWHVSITVLSRCDVPLSMGLPGLFQRPTNGTAVSLYLLLQNISCTLSAAGYDLTSSAQ